MDHISHDTRNHWTVITPGKDYRHSPSFQEQGNTLKNEDVSRTDTQGSSFFTVDSRKLIAAIELASIPYRVMPHETLTKIAKTRLEHISLRNNSTPTHLVKRSLKQKKRG